MMDDLNNLPILKVFKGLKRGDSVYSKQYGVGTVRSLYKDDEVIVQFSSLTKRLSVHDGVSEMPEKYFKKPKNTKIEVVCDGNSMSFKEFKKKNRAERERMKLEQELLKDERKRRRV